MMTKKDYIRAAKIVQNTHDEFSKESLLHAVLEDSFVCFFRGDNPRFDETRFREACKP